MLIEMPAVQAGAEDLGNLTVIAGRASATGCGCR
jgi:hypothetical protein